MGTDMNMYAEIKKDGAWHLLSEMEENQEYFPEDNPNAQPIGPVDLYNGRNYDLFAILADVRNPTGRTFDNQKFDSISQPRGLPDDLSPEIRAWTKDFEDEDGDTDISCPSWLLLSEILEFGWNTKVMRYQAMVDARVAHLFNENKPFPKDKWPEGVSMSAAQYFKDGVTVRWAAPYFDSVDGEFYELIERLRKHDDPSQIRLVFWFYH